MMGLKASTLMEVLVAIVIITLITSLFFGIIINVGNYHKNREGIIIQQQLIELIGEAKKQGYLDDETLEFESYYIQKSVKPYKEIPSIWEINVEAFDLNDKHLASHKAIIEEQIFEFD